MQLATPQAFSRLDPDTTARIRRGQAGKATKAQSAVEYVLFAVFGLTIVLSLVTLVVVNSPQHKLVPNRVATGLQQGRVNVLVIGTSLHGSESDTDSLILVSVKPGTHQVAMISIPRDLWVRLGRYGTHRLAAAESVGQASGYPGEGAGLTSDTIEQITGQPVHAYVRLDGRDLQSAIDALGGIDIHVNHSFYEYKTRDRFRPGVQHMDGDRALRFAKSRCVLGPQGSRFARELREQQVIAAVLDKMQTADTPANLATQRSSTNLEPAQIATLTQAVRSAGAVQHVSLEPLMDVISAPSFADADDALQPRGGDFTQLQSVLRDVFTAPTVAMLSR